MGVVEEDPSCRKTKDWYGLMRVVRSLAVMLLIVAAASKILRFPEILASDGLLAYSPWLLRIVIAVEAGLAAIILTIPTYLARYTIIVTFGFFSFVALSAIVTARDCNCISEIIPVHVMFVSDILIVGLAFIARNAPSDPLYGRRKLSSALSAGAVAGVFFFVASIRPVVPINDDDKVLNYLLADALVGKRWPLDSRYHPRLSELESGEWLIVILRKDCNHCRELIADFSQSLSRYKARGKTIVVITGEQPWDFAFQNVSFSAEPDGIIDWGENSPFVVSPAVFNVVDGKVRSAADGADSESFLKRYFSLADSIGEF